MQLKHWVCAVFAVNPHHSSRSDVLLRQLKMPRVLNIRTASLDDLKGAVIVDRRNRWGNPHKIGWCSRCQEVHDRIGAVDAYKKSLIANPMLVAAIRQNLRGKDVACWCWPDLCHGSIIIEVANGNPSWLESV